MSSGLRSLGAVLWIMLGFVPVAIFGLAFGYGLILFLTGQVRF